jgi:hypothetical protein
MCIKSPFCHGDKIFEIIKSGWKGLIWLMVSEVSVCDHLTYSSIVHYGRRKWWRGLFTSYYPGSSKERWECAMVSIYPSLACSQFPNFLPLGPGYTTSQ